MDRIFNRQDARNAKVLPDGLCYYFLNRKVLARLANADGRGVL
jgi:hypothetical protein